MPNGDDANWVRLCAAVNGFRSRYLLWPTKIRLLPGCLEDLRGHLFSTEAFAKVEESMTTDRKGSPSSRPTSMPRFGLVLNQIN